MNLIEIFATWFIVTLFLSAAFSIPFWTACLITSLGWFLYRIGD